MFRECDEYNRSHIIQDWKNHRHPESEMNHVTVIVLHYVTWENRVVSDSNVTWIMVESTSGMKSLYFEEANCTVLASYFHIRKGSTDKSPQNNLTPNIKFKKFVDVCRHQNQKCDCRFFCPQMALHDVPKMPQIGVKTLKLSAIHPRRPS